MYITKVAVQKFSSYTYFYNLIAYFDIAIKCLV